MVFHGMMGKPQNGTDQIQLTAASSHLRLEPGEQVSGVLPGTAIRTFSAQEHRALGLLSVRSSKHFIGWQDLKLNGAEHESASLPLLFLQKNPMRVICERLHPASSEFPVRCNESCPGPALLIFRTPRNCFMDSFEATSRWRSKYLEITIQKYSEHRTDFTIYRQFVDNVSEMEREVKSLASFVLWSQVKLRVWSSECLCGLGLTCIC